MSPKLRETIFRYIIPLEKELSNFMIHNRKADT